MKCHSVELFGDARHGAPTTINFDTYELAKKNAVQANAVVGPGVMPPGGLPEVFLEGAGGDGYSVPAPTRLDPRATPHPLASLLQAIHLTGRVDRVGRREYVFLSGWSGTPFGPVYDRLRGDPSWRTHRIESGHNVMRDAPDALLAILLSVAAR